MKRNWRAAIAAAAVLGAANGPVAAAHPHHTHTPPDPAAAIKYIARAQDAALPANAQRFSHGRFDDIVVFKPATTATQVVIFLSGNSGLNLGLVDMAQTLVEQGAMVIGVNTPMLVAELEQDGGDCTFPDGDFENLAHFVEAYEHLGTYRPPILAGYDSGATLAYALLAQSPKDTFAGALTLGFRPGLDMHEPMCEGSGLEFTKRADGRGVDFLPAKSLPQPWITLQGAVDQVDDPMAIQKFASQVPGAEIVMLPKVGHSFSVPANWMPQYRSAYQKLASANRHDALPPPPAALGDLPIIEVPAQPGHAESDTFAVLLSGDGGWAGLDQDVASALTAQGIPVVGLDSLRYYWTPRTPEGLGSDLDRLIRYYLAHWHKQRVLLVGYSQGADVLPFGLNHLPPATHEHVALGAVMGMSEHATFEFHMSNWVSDDDDSGPSTLAEMERVSGVPMLCIYGEDDDDTVCPKLDPNKVHIVKLKGGHHFDGDYERLAKEILSAARSAS